MHTSFVLCMQNDNQICQTKHFKMFVLNFIVKKEILLLQISHKVFSFPLIFISFSMTDSKLIDWLIVLSLNQQRHAAFFVHYNQVCLRHKLKLSTDFNDESLTCLTVIELSFLWTVWACVCLFNHMLDTFVSRSDLNLTKSHKTSFLGHPHL